MSLVALAVAVAVAAPGAPSGRRPRVDVAAMREAMGSREPVPFPSASSYAHFLAARLAQGEGDRRRATDELVLALATDPRSPYLLTELARQHVRAGDLARAEASLKELLAIHPGYAPAQLLMGRVLIDARRPARARAHLDLAIRASPTDPEAYLVKSQLLLAQGRVDDAIRTVEQLGAAVPDDTLGYRRLGLLLAQRQDARAGPLLRRAVERDRSDVEAWGALAAHHERLDQPAEARAAYAAAVEHDPQNRELLLAAGRFALKAGQRADADAYFAQLLNVSRDPEVVVRVAFSYLAEHHLEAAARVLDQARSERSEPRLHFYAGLVHERLGNFAEAADAFARVGPGLKEISDEAELRRAVSLAALGKPQQALDALSALEARSPSAPGVTVARARVLERAGRVDEARDVLVGALASRPSAEVADGLTTLLTRHGRLAEAVTLLERTRGEHPADDVVDFALALALERSGQWERALTVMRAVLTRSPRDAAAANFVGYTLANHGKSLDEAYLLVQRALTQRPEVAAYLDSMGWVLHHKGDHREALSYLERAAERSPDDPTLQEHLGVVLLKLGQLDRARAALTAALRLLNETPESAERPDQRESIAGKLKLLSARPASR